MKQFAQLLEDLELAPGPGDQTALLSRYLRKLSDEEKSAALQLLSGDGPRRFTDSARLKEWMLELSGIPEWLFLESGKASGDLAETIALLLPFPGGIENRSLVYWTGAAARLASLDPDSRKAWVLDSWRLLGPRERVIFNKLLFKSLKPPVSRRVLVAALSRLTRIDTAILTWRLSRQKTILNAGRAGGSVNNAINSLLSYPELAKKETVSDQHVRPYPLLSCPALEVENCEPGTGSGLTDLKGEKPEADSATRELTPAEELTSPEELNRRHWLEGRLGPASGWTAQWKWAGIPAQLIYRSGQLHLWAQREDRGRDELSGGRPDLGGWKSDGAVQDQFIPEELLTACFPELHGFMKQLPEGTVLEGELLGMRDGILLPAAGLEKRIGRKSFPKSLLTQLPAIFQAIDCLEYEGKDVRHCPAGERRRLLESLQKRIDHGSFRCSQLISFNSWDQLAAAHARTRDYGAEGILLTKNDLSVSGPEGARWHWKAKPYVFRGVLLYARRGTSTDAFTQFSLGAWERGKLVSFATVASSLGPGESEELAAFIRENSLEKFGPVRTVKPAIVFEIAFDSILPSARHRCGIRLCYPRMRSWLKSAPPEEAGMLESLRNLCGHG